MKDKISLLDIKQSLKLFSRFNKYLLRYWKFELITLILGNFAIVLSLVNPYIGKNILDKGILAKDIRAFVIYTLLGVGVYVLGLVMNNIHRYFKNYIIRRIRIDLAKDIFKRFNRYSLRLFQDRSSGSNLFRVGNDTTAAINIINDTLPNIITCIFKLILITAIIIFINWKILILVIVYQLLVLLQINLFIKRIERFFILNLEKSEDIFAILNQFFRHIYIIKVFGTMAGEIKRLFHFFIAKVRIDIKNTRLMIVVDTLNSISNKLFFGVIGFYGSILVIRGQLTLGSLGAIMAYIAQATGAYSALLNLGKQIVLNRISLQRVSELMDAPIEIKEKYNAKNIILNRGQIEFRNVNFGYKKDKYILNNMSFVIQPCAHVAIAGNSGCGKTTILNLILRLYDVNKGAILLDDYDIKDIKFKSIYTQIGIATQEPFLWDYSIRDNIAYTKNHATLVEIIRASKIAQIYEFVESLPNSFDTLIGEDACRISQGQKQRIAIARAVIKQPKILILDEAMSSLDSDTEDNIIDNIRNEFPNSTVIIVSHRISTIKRMDLVYFFENESNMNIGTHQFLLEQSQKYRELLASQIDEGILVDE